MSDYPDYNNKKHRDCVRHNLSNCGSGVIDEACEMIDFLESQLAAAREREMAAVNEVERLRERAERAEKELTEHREEHNDLCDGLNKALDVAGYVWEDESTYATGINWLNEKIKTLEKRLVIPPGEQIFCSSVLDDDGHSYGILFLARNWDIANDRNRIIKGDKNFGILGGSGELTPDGTLTTWSNPTLLDDDEETNDDGEEADNGNG